MFIFQKIFSYWNKKSLYGCTFWAKHFKLCSGREWEAMRMFLAGSSLRGWGQLGGWRSLPRHHLPPTSGGHTCDGYEWQGLSLHHFQQLLGLPYQRNGNKRKFPFWGEPYTAFIMEYLCYFKEFTISDFVGYFLSGKDYWISVSVVFTIFNQLTHIVLRSYGCPIPGGI